MVGPTMSFDGGNINEIGAGLSAPKIDGALNSCKAEPDVLIEARG